MRAEPRRAEENQFEKLKPTILGCLEGGIARKGGCSKCGVGVVLLAGKGIKRDEGG